MGVVCSLLDFDKNYTDDQVASVLTWLRQFCPADITVFRFDGWCGPENFALILKNLPTCIKIVGLPCDDTMSSMTTEALIKAFGDMPGTVETLFIYWSAIGERTDDERSAIEAAIRRPGVTIKRFRGPSNHQSSPVASAPTLFATNANHNATTAGGAAAADPTAKQAIRPARI